MIAVLAGCGSGGSNETNESEKNTKPTSTTEVSSSKTVQSSSEKKIELKDVDFQVEGTNYKMKVVESWDVVKKSMKEDMIFDDEFQIKEETIKEEPYQTTHYTGELYGFIGNTEAINVEVRFYYLETETEYVVLNFIGLPSFFEKNGDIVTEMLNSFVVG